MNFDSPVKPHQACEMLTVEILVERGIIESPLDGNHGEKHPTASDYVDEGIPFIMASDLTNGKIDLEKCKFITSCTAETLRKGFAKENDVLLTHKATIGRTAIVPKLNTPFIILTPQVTYYRIRNSEILNPNYLKYYFDSEFFQNILQTWAGAGSTRAYIGITSQLKLPVLLPSIKMQNFIVDSVKPIDSKIEINSRINKTLEFITQSIFKSWFVDFDPVYAKVKAIKEGRDPELAAMATIAGKTEAEIQKLKGRCVKLADTLLKFEDLRHIASLFPGELVDSKQGRIPKEWNYSTLEEATSLIIDHRGKTPKKLGGEWVEHGVPAISAKNIKNDQIVNWGAIKYVNKQIYKKWMKTPLQAGDIILTSEAPLGETMYLTQTEEYCLSQRLFALRANENVINGSYLYFWLKTDEAINDMQCRATGTTALGIRQSELKKIKVLLPRIQLANRFSKIINPLLSLRSSNLYSNRLLASVRDELLPKLIAGDIHLETTLQEAL